MSHKLSSMIFVMAVASILGAADKPAPSPTDQARAMAELQQKLLKQFDLNQDGVLSDAEKLAAQEAMAKQGINAPGMLPGGPAAADFAKRFDKNGDGKLDDAEKLAAQAAWNRLRGGDGRQGGGGPAIGPQGNSPPIAPPISNAKGKGDGKEEKGNPIVKRFDKDGDGKLNDEEKAAVQAELKKKKEKAPK